VQRNMADSFKYGLLRVEAQNLLFPRPISKFHELASGGDIVHDQVFVFALSRHEDHSSTIVGKFDGIANVSQFPMIRSISLESGPLNKRVDAIERSHVELPRFLSVRGIKNPFVR